MKILVAMSCRSSIDARTVHAILDLMSNPPHECDFLSVQGEGYVGRARNSYTAKFLAGDWTDLLNVDSDIIPTKDKIERICSHDVDIVGGIYYKKNPLSREAVLEPLPDRPRADENGLMPVRYMGTGFLRIRKKVFLDMIDKYPIEYLHENGQTEWDFWPCAIDPTQNRYLSEDWFFCHRANELGYTVYADTKCVVQHIGTAVYPLPR